MIGYKKLSSVMVLLHPIQIAVNTTPITNPQTLKNCIKSNSIIRINFNAYPSSNEG